MVFPSAKGLLILAGYFIMAGSAAILHPFRLNVCGLSCGMIVEYPGLPWTDC